MVITTVLRNSRDLNAAYEIPETCPRCIHIYTRIIKLYVIIYVIENFSFDLLVAYIRFIRKQNEKNYKFIFILFVDIRREVNHRTIVITIYRARLLLSCRSTILGVFSRPMFFFELFFCIRPFSSVLKKKQLSLSLSLI